MSIANIRNEFLREIKIFCNSSNLSFEKVMSFPQSCNENTLAVQYWDESLGTNGLLEETPAEIILLAKKADGKIDVEKQENTDKYLSV